MKKELVLDAKEDRIGTQVLRMLEPFSFLLFLLHSYDVHDSKLSKDNLKDTMLEIHTTARTNYRILVQLSKKEDDELVFLKVRSLEGFLRAMQIFIEKMTGRPRYSTMGKLRTRCLSYENAMKVVGMLSGKNA